MNTYFEVYRHTTGRTVVTSRQPAHPWHIMGKVEAGNINEARKLFARGECVRGRDAGYRAS